MFRTFVVALAATLLPALAVAPAHAADASAGRPASRFVQDPYPSTYHRIPSPPVLIQASRAEILLDDARMMAARLEADGVEVTLELDRGVPHVWQAFHGWLPEADAALGRAAAFLRRCLKIA